MNTKPTMILAALLLSAGSLMAQSTSHTSFLQHHSGEAQKAIQKLRSVMPREQQKTTAEHQRLVAQSYMNGSLTMPMQVTDSYAYSYPDTSFKSSFNYQDMYYPDFYTYPDYYTGIVEYDTMYHYMDVVPPDTMLRTYDASGNITWQKGFDYRSYFSYNSSNQLEMQEHQSYDGLAMVWDTSDRVYFIYDNNNRLVVDSTVVNAGGGVWEKSGKSEYTYNTAGLPTSVLYSSWLNGVWEPSFKVDVTYAGGMPHTMLGQSFDGTNWIPSFRDSNNYSSGQLVSAFSDLWLGVSWERSSEEFRHLNGNIRPDSIFLRQYSNFGGFWDTTITNVTYNSYNNPVKMESMYSYPDSPVSINNFYYELIGGTAGIPAPPHVKELAVYPNPAKDQLYIKLGQLTGNRLHMNVINSLGQVVYKSTNNNNQLMAVPVHQLPAGAYWLSIQDGNDVYRASFMKN